MARFTNLSMKSHSYRTSGYRKPILHFKCKRQKSQHHSLQPSTCSVGAVDSWNAKDQKSANKEAKKWSITTLKTSQK